MFAKPNFRVMSLMLFPGLVIIYFLSHHTSDTFMLAAAFLRTANIFCRGGNKVVLVCIYERL